LSFLPWHPPPQQVVLVSIVMDQPQSSFFTLFDFDSFSSISSSYDRVNMLWINFPFNYFILSTILDPSIGILWCVKTWFFVRKCWWFVSARFLAFGQSFREECLLLGSATLFLEGCSPETGGRRSMTNDHQRPMNDLTFEEIMTAVPR
jgi:hypothetical protein